MQYSDAVEFLDENFVSFQTAGRTAYKGGLETITAMCRAMGNPQNDYLTIHIAGTNGKGSVAHMLASILQEAGYRTGLFTSPHMHDFRERVRVDGEVITETGVAEFFAGYGEKMKELGLSYFEMTTAMAFKWFSESAVEVAVVETGLGGRLDATNVVVPALSIITNIGLDHTDILGDTKAKIAAEKAGIIKKRVPVLIGETDPETEPVFVAKASEMGAPIMFADRIYECVEKTTHIPWQRYTLQRVSDGRTQDIDLDLKGDYQQKNLITVRTAVSLLKRYSPVNISTRALLEGSRNVVANTGLLGRWQVISEQPMTVADAGHNAHGIAEVVRQIAAEKYDKLYVVLGFAADKEMDEILPLMPKDAYYIFTQADSPRALPALELEEAAAAYGLRGESRNHLNDAVARAKEMAGPEDMIFVGGSIYLISEVV